MTIKEAFSKFKDLKIAVIGDVMVDAYIWGKVSRISPEAPVPIINLSKREDRLGGAANVALNLVALGIESEIISVVGKDDGGEKLKKLFADKQISFKNTVESPDRITTIKTRVIGNSQHLLRVDNEQTNEISTAEEDALIAAAKKSIEEGVNAIIFEDYNKGVLTDRVIREIVDLANANKVITTVDPKKENFFSFQNVTMFKPNLKELKEGMKSDFDFSEFSLFEQAVIDLEAELKNKITFVTLSEHGVYVKEGIKRDHLAAHLRDISDVSGAGDTVIAVATACLAAGLTPVQMANVANLAGGLVCESTGVVAIDMELLIKEVQNKLNGH